MSATPDLQRFEELAERLKGALHQIDEEAASEKPSAGAIVELETRNSALEQELTQAKAQVSQLEIDLDAARSTVEQGEPSEDMRAEIERLQLDMAEAEARDAETIRTLRAQLEAVEDKSSAPSPEASHETSYSGPEELLKALEDLRQEAVKTVSDPEAINKALEAEVTTLHMMRKADLAELKALLAELEPVLEEATHA